MINRISTLIITLLLTIVSCKRESNGSSSQETTLRLELFTSDMEASINFYTDVLGFTMAGEKPDPSYQVVTKGGVVLGIGPINKLSPDHYFDPKLKNTQKGYGAEIVLEVEDIGELYQKVKSNGYPIHSDLKKQNWGLTDFRLIDPDGYYLRITSKN